MLLLRGRRSLLIGIGAGLATLCLTARAEEKPLFEERFSDQLSAGWEWIDEQPGAWQLVADTLELKVMPVGEGLWAGGRKHPNLLLRRPAREGDFAVEVQLKSTPTAKFEHAGLLLYADGDNYVAINKEMLDRPEIVMVTEKASQPKTSDKPYEHEDVCLRLAVNGKRVTGQFRHYDSDEWQTIAEHELPVPGPYKIGLFAGRPPEDSDHRVRFSRFYIRPSTTPATTESPTPPPAKQAQGGAPLATSSERRRTVRTDVPLAAQAGQAAERAIPYIEKQGTTWINDRKCLACHYVAFMVWSLRDAGDRGLGVDKTRLAEWTDWSLKHAVGQGTEGPAQMLLARDRTDQSEVTLKLIESLRDAIIKEQDKDGFWKPGGQLPSQKRPLAETTQVSTMWNVLALDSLEPPNEKGIESRDKALGWLKGTSPNGEHPAASSEWYAARLLIERKFGDPRQVDTLRDQILAAQQPDGGWGWLRADKSDAFGTGLSLYALSHVGLSGSNPAVQRAWRFLIETQTDDGSWIVNGTKMETKDKPHPFSSFWGSTWALLGLASSLPDSAPTAVSSDTRAARVPVID